jgi:hypothetical protein
VGISSRSSNRFFYFSIKYCLLSIELYLLGYIMFDTNYMNDFYDPMGMQNFIMRPIFG